ncbi:hypothetical protein D9M71_585740 [compost metagenome]|jgi:cytochrome c biogenesis protein CcdA
MDKAFRNIFFVVGLVLSVVGAGVAMNFLLRSKSIDVQVIILFIVGVVLTISGWKQCQRK